MPMNLIEAVILGVVQGVTEFFPISSSGHLVIFQHILGFKEPMLAFDIFLHFGTIVSVLVFFWKDIMSILKGKSPILKFIFIGSIPTFAIAILFKDTVESFFAAPLVVGYSLIVTGIFLFITNFFAVRNKRTQRKKDLNAANSVIVGIAQGISIIPGVSRSGSTIGASLIAGLEEGMAIKFSFLLSIPAILGANLLKIREIYGNLVSIDTVSFLAGGIAAMITGIVAIRVLYGILKRNLFFLFGIYCLAAGVAVVMLVSG